MMRLGFLLSAGVLLSVCAHADFVAYDDADEAMYANNNTFYNGQNGGSGFSAWTNGVSGKMETVGLQELSGLHYWKISDAQTLYRPFADSVGFSQGVLSLKVLHQDGGSVLLTSSENETLLTIETGTFWDEDDYEMAAGFILTSGEATTYVRSDYATENVIDYTIEWNTEQQTYEFQAVIDISEYLPSITNTVSGALAFLTEIGGIGFSTKDDEALHFDEIGVVPEPAAISLVLLCSGGMLFVKRRFYV
ncbi:hypothetical protein [Pontiella sulfatireligans]|uniref:PEP-CTERM protein-sorting domain-containing protein n=1 Tax=Pontiella sulfatireligans TaxID=2750658 RepID=A0A6C2ULG0_9BACT|nr:hypothetical protein [Pontiella sulfatireligans]VGO20809.1 hypothetical protein SCARR_02876 [Pontiella sulfatireligans]